MRVFIADLYADSHDVHRLRHVSERASSSVIGSSEHLAGIAMSSQDKDI